VGLGRGGELGGLGGLGGQRGTRVALEGSFEGSGSPALGVRSMTALQVLQVLKPLSQLAGTTARAWTLAVAHTGKIIIEARDENWRETAKSEER